MANVASDPAIDPGSPASVSDAAFARRVPKPWGWEVIWTPADMAYVGKVLHIWAGQRLSLQVHELKTESWLLVGGRAKVVWNDTSGQLVECELMAGRGYTCEHGRQHRLVGITDCDIIEVSTPEIGTTWRLEDDFGRSDESDADRAAGNR